MCLTHTLADLMFRVEYLSYFMEKLTSEHVKAAKRILRYVKVIVNFGLIYVKGENEAEFVGYSNDDFACDEDD